MYKVNDKVVHAREGLSTIVDTTKMMDREYFVIHSDCGKGENIYVLVDNTENIIRPVMKKNEAKAVIDYMKTVAAEFIDNTKQRRDQYKRRLLSGSVKDLAYLCCQLHFYYLLNSQGQIVKLGPTDLQMLRDAQKILFDEFAISFGLHREKVAEFVEKYLS